MRRCERHHIEKTDHQRSERKPNRNSLLTSGISDRPATSTCMVLLVSLFLLLAH